jgi:antitoxin PrlF
MITSKITSKAQTTIPQPVRAALHVGEGEGGHVILTKARREPVDDPSLLSMSGRPRRTGAPMAIF